MVRIVQYLKIQETIYYRNYMEKYLNPQLVEEMSSKFLEGFNYCCLDIAF